MNLDKKGTFKLLGIIFASIIFFAALTNLGDVLPVIRKIFGVFAPIVVGIAIAFVLNIPLRLLECRVFRRLTYSSKAKVWKKIKRPVCLAISVVLVLVIFSFGTIFCLSVSESIPEFIKGLSYVSVCGLLATSFIYLIFLRKENSITQDDLLFNFNPKLANIILHYLAPILSLVSLVFFEQEIILTNGIWTALVAIPSCLYWLVYLILSATKKWDEPYKLSAKNKFIEALTFILIPISFIVISIVLWNII